MVERCLGAGCGRQNLAQNKKPRHVVCHGLPITSVLRRKTDAPTIVSSRYSQMKTLNQNQPLTRFLNPRSRSRNPTPIRSLRTPKELRNRRYTGPFPCRWPLLFQGVARFENCSGLIRLDVPVVCISGYGLERIDKCQAEVIRTVHLQRRLDTVAFNGTMRMDFDIEFAVPLVIDQIPLGPGLRCYISL